MVQRWAVGLAAFLLVGCSSLEFYAPEVGPGWTSERVEMGTKGISVDGVSVRREGEEYSPVVSVGNLLAPSYSGARKAIWSVTGPKGLRATVEVIQSNLLFTGPVERNVLNSNEIDFERGRQVLLVRVNDGVSLSTPGPIEAPISAQLMGMGITATTQGQAGGKVSDYKRWGLVTGLRLTDGGRLVGYLSLTNGLVLKKAPQAEAKPLLVALALIASQTPFPNPTPAQRLVPEVFDVFGLPFSTVTTHN